MYKSIPAIILALFGTIVLGGNAQAQSNSVSLATVANRSSYNVQWLLPERSIRLYRPGLVILIRPGVREYDVNNRIEFSDVAPAYVNGDMLVSPSLAARLKRLASMAAAAPRRTSGNGMQITVGSAAESGPITVDVRPQEGSEALNVTGHAPSGAPVTITLLATISPDLPTVVLSRHDVQPDTNGQFQAVISNAPDYLRGSLLQVVATSAAATPATATVIVGAPNANVKVPFDKPYCPNTLCPHA